METEVREAEHELKTERELLEEIALRLKRIHIGIYAFLLGAIIGLMCR